MSSKKTYPRVKKKKKKKNFSVNFNISLKTNSILKKKKISSHAQSTCDEASVCIYIYNLQIYSLRDICYSKTLIFIYASSITAIGHRCQFV